jgi:hypothetical protein
MTSFLLSPLRTMTTFISLETMLLEEIGSILFPIKEDYNEVMEDHGIWMYGEIPIDVSL